MADPSRALRAARFSPKRNLKTVVIGVASEDPFEAFEATRPDKGSHLAGDLEAPSQANVCWWPATVQGSTGPSVSSWRSEGMGELRPIGRKCSVSAPKSSWRRYEAEATVRYRVALSVADSAGFIVTNVLDLPIPTQTFGAICKTSGVFSYEMRVAGE